MLSQVTPDAQTLAGRLRLTSKTAARRSWATGSAPHVRFQVALGMRSHTYGPNLQVSQIREEHIQTAGFPACQAKLHNDPRGRSLMISSWSNTIFTNRPHPWTACYAIAIIRARGRP